LGIIGINLNKLKNVFKRKNSKNLIEQRFLMLENIDKAVLLHLILPKQNMASYLNVIKKANYLNDCIFKINENGMKLILSSSQTLDKIDDIEKYNTSHNIINSIFEQFGQIYEKDVEEAISQGYIQNGKNEYDEKKLFVSEKGQLKLIISKAEAIKNYENFIVEDDELSKNY